MPVRSECRQRRPLFLSILFDRVPPSGSAVKSAGRTRSNSAAKGMFHLPFHFVGDQQELQVQLFPSSSRPVRIAAA